MSTRTYLFDPFIPQPSRITTTRTAWEQYQRETEVFAGFPSATYHLKEWIPGHFYPNGVQIAGAEIVVSTGIDESGMIAAAESLVSAGAAVTMFAAVSGLPTALVVAASKVLQ